MVNQIGGYHQLQGPLANYGPSLHNKCLFHGNNDQG